MLVLQTNQGKIKKIILSGIQSRVMLLFLRMALRLMEHFVQLTVHEFLKTTHLELKRSAHIVLKYVNPYVSAEEQNDYGSKISCRIHKQACGMRIKLLMNC